VIGSLILMEYDLLHHLTVYIPSAKYIHISLTSIKHILIYISFIQVTLQAPEIDKHIIIIIIFVKDTAKPGSEITKTKCSFLT
jgi:hypothetical protein